MKKIFIADSFLSNKLSNILSELFEGKVEIYCDPNYSPTYFPLDVSDEDVRERMNKIEAQSKKFINTTSKDNFDLFFLSAKIITQGDLNPENLKQNYGKPNSKVIAISSVDGFLDRAIKFYGADYGLHKSKIRFAESVHDLKEEDRDLLHSFLEDDFFNRIHPIEGQNIFEKITFEAQKIRQDFGNQKFVDFSKFDELLDQLSALRNKNKI